jgi:transmembrane sensor
LSSNEDIELLLSDPDFRQWISHPTDALDTYWHAWLLSHPDQEDNFYLAKEIIQSLLEDGLSVSEESVAYNVEGILDKTIRKKRRITSDFSWFSVAASILLVAALAYYNFRNQDNPISGKRIAQSDVRWLQFANSGKEPGHITLPDGSTVIVLPNSKIVYPEKFSDSLRGIELTGEAFFEVTKDPHRPFVVSSSRLKTSVLGTSFRIKDVKNEAPLVRVKTGTVSVNFTPHTDDSEKQPKSDVKKLILQAHQEVKFSDFISGTLPVPSAVDEGTAGAGNLPIESNNFIYRRTPVAEVFETLKNTYAVGIKYDAEKLQNCTLTARLGDQPLVEKLRMVCLGLNLQFAIDKNGLVTISGDGCH